MTFKDVQTALKALKIKKTIQEISDFFSQNSLSLETAVLEDVVKMFQEDQILNQREKLHRLQNRKFSTAKAKENSFTVLGRFHALERDGLIYVMLVNSPKITTISIHDEMKDAEYVAQCLNTVYGL